MPQFDQFMFLTQILWFFVLFWILYYVLISISLPHIYSNIYIRKKLQYNFLAQNKINDKLFFQKLYINNFIYKKVLILLEKTFI
jgi:hypothetical protein